MARIVVGIDGGGTHTRALAVDVTGRVIASVKGGGTNPFFNADAEQSLRTAIAEVVRQAHCSLGDVAALVAGLAGLDTQADYAKFTQYIELPGLECAKLLLNDAVIAHCAALRSRPGILAISGTGANVAAITETGQVIRNHDFKHFSQSAARFLGVDALHRILIGQAMAADGPLVNQVLRHLEVKDTAALWKICVVLSSWPPEQVHRKLGTLAPLITAAAQTNMPLACAVIQTAARSLATGIGLVGGCFEDTGGTILYAMAGSVATAPAMRMMVAKELATHGRKYEEVVPTLTPAAGAVLRALDLLGIALDEPLIETLGAHADARC